ncbi:MAG: alpha/beta hydrolase [Pseudomonadota bacterium]
MRRVNFENEYNNRKRVREHGELTERWDKAADDFRNAAADRSELDIAYGDGERHHYDLFQPEERADEAQLIAFIHGGYWQRGDRKNFSCIAEPLTKAGFAVALPSYSHCPDVGVMDIVAEMRAFVVALHKKTGRKPLVVGHSAGGHLAASMLTTDWSEHGSNHEDLVTDAYAISGVFQLRPLLRTSINDALELDKDAADAASPLLWDAPKEGRRLVAAVGALESREFIRQSLEMAGAWGKAGATTECVVIPDANHFTVLDHLMTPGNGVFARVADMAAARG